MDVDDLILPLVAEGIGQDGHKAGQHDQADTACRQLFMQRRTVLLGVREIAAAQHVGLDSRLGRALECVRVRVGREHKVQLAVLDLTACLRVDECLQVGAAARDENCYLGHIALPFSSYRSWIPFSPVTHSPMM